MVEPITPENQLSAIKYKFNEAHKTKRQRLRLCERTDKGEETFKSAKSMRLYFESTNKSVHKSVQVRCSCLGE